MKTSNPIVYSRLATLLIFCGFVAFLFSFIIMLEKLAVMIDPAHVAPCTINPFISCNAVMASPQASVFGFPNPLLGIAGFAVVMTVGFAMLAGAQFKKWFWKLLNIGHFLAILFVYWLFYEAVYDIHSLCLYCIIVWFMMIPIFTQTLRYSIQSNHFLLFGSQKVSTFFEKRAFWLTLLMYAVIVLAILQHFWSSWLALL